jgi:hypothetical protein
LLRQKTEPTDPLPMHPPWRVGQYVTYFLERDDGGPWTALAIEIAGQANDGAWILSADLKTVAGECRMWLRSDPNARPETIDPLPGPVETVRRSGSDPAVDDLAGVFTQPEDQTALAMNLLLVRRFPGAADALRTPPRWRRYPCGIEKVHMLVTPAPTYQKHHALNPRVMITGVACLSVDGDSNPMTATSFGLRAPNTAASAPYDDWVDYSHPQRVEHDPFALTYPATWFLRPDREDVENTKVYAARVGGNSYAFTLLVTFEQGTPDTIAKSRDEKTQRLSRQSQQSMGVMTPDTGTALPSVGDNDAFVLNFRSPDVEGLNYVAMYRSESGDRLAAVSAFGCVSKASPRRREALFEIEDESRRILESFRWSGDE